MAYKKEQNATDNNSNAKDRALERFAEMMIERIEKIKDDWKKPWFTEGETNLSWPKNLDGRPYNGMNALLLLLHCTKEGYRVPVFMTFDRIAALNYTKGKDGKYVPLTDTEGKRLPYVSINKGAKSFPVFLTLFTVINEETKKKIPYDQYKKLNVEEQKKYHVYPNMRVYNVFNIDQSNLKETRPELYEELWKANVRERPETNGDVYSFPAMDEIIDRGEWLCPIRLLHQNRAYFSPDKDEIVLPEKAQFYNGEAFYGTAFHEMVHSTGTEERLNRQNLNTSFGSKEYAQEELVAELGSALVAKRYGMLKTVKDESCSYLKNWLEKLKESPQFIKTILLDVKRATQLLTEKIDAVNQRIEERHGTGMTDEPLPLTSIPEDALTEIHVTDKEAGDAIEKLLGNNQETVSRPEDCLVTLKGNHSQAVMEMLANNLDAETLSKVMKVSLTYQGIPIDYQEECANRELTTFLLHMNGNPEELKKYGMEKDEILHIHSQYALTGQFILATEKTGHPGKVCVTDSTGNLILTPKDLEPEIDPEIASGYRQEILKRLKSEHSTVDEWGRIRVEEVIHKEDSTEIIGSKIMIDSEMPVRAEFPASMDDTPEFILDADSIGFPENEEERKRKALLKNYVQAAGSRIYGLEQLLRLKDSLYPPRVITHKINIPLAAYLASNIGTSIVSEMAEPEKKPGEEIRQSEGNNKPETESKHGTERTLESRTKVAEKLYATCNEQGLWGLEDESQRIVFPPQWKECRLDDSGNLHLFTTTEESQVTDKMANREIDHAGLASLSEKISRISALGIEERGAHREKWLVANIDGEPVLSEKISDAEVRNIEEGKYSLLEVAIRRFDSYLHVPRQEENVSQRVHF